MHALFTSLFAEEFIMKEWKIDVDMWQGDKVNDKMVNLTFLLIQKIQKQSLQDRRRSGGVNFQFQGMSNHKRPFLSELMHIAHYIHSKQNVLSDMLDISVHICSEQSSCLGVQIGLWSFWSTSYQHFPLATNLHHNFAKVLLSCGSSPILTGQSRLACLSASGWHMRHHQQWALIQCYLCSRKLFVL